jgi:ABC-2 type transport system ATP-binding protein
MNFTAPYICFPMRLTVFENLMVFARLYGVRDCTSKIAGLLRLFGIQDVKHKPVSQLSSGQNTRVGLCKAFMNDPRVLLLDEPTAYLDPEVAMRVKRVLLDLQESCGTTILYTSHNMAEVEEMCSQIVFLSYGRVIASGTPIEVTHAILEEDRNEPALHEVFLRLAREPSDEAA